MAWDGVMIAATTVAMIVEIAGRTAATGDSEQEAVDDHGHDGVGDR